MALPSALRYDPKCLELLLEALMDVSGSITYGVHVVD